MIWKAKERSRAKLSTGHLFGQLSWSARSSYSIFGFIFLLLYILCFSSAFTLRRGIPKFGDLMISTKHSPPNKHAVRSLRRKTTQNGNGVVAAENGHSRNPSSDTSESLTRLSMVSGGACSSEMGGNNQATLKHQELQNPSGMRAEVFQEALDLYHRMRACRDTYISGEINRALDVLADAYRLYGARAVFCSYNGGKDAVVVTHLMRAALARHCVDIGCIHRPRVIYFSHDKEFSEILSLIQETTEKFDLELITYDCGFVEGLTQQVEKEGVPTAFVLGTRKGDPNCGSQQFFTPSSTWMPPFMRVNPVIEWNYGQIWQFIKEFDLPYPSLYDNGYTSLGKIDNTFPNPSLKKEDGTYLPAYMLTDWTKERAGREVRETSSLECDLKDLDTRRRRVNHAKTAGLIIIGDEILKGKTPDTNTVFTMEKLQEIGVQLRRIAIISDDHTEISDEVRRQVQDCDVVFTSGGLGPTHDDVTIRAVANALGQRLSQSEQMVKKLMVAYKADKLENLSDAQLKMAMLPELAKLRVPEDDKDAWPILQCENVFILPGVPQFFEAKMNVITKNFLKSRFIASRKIVLKSEESSIVDQLDAAVKSFPNISFGSYPFFDNPNFKTVITLEGTEIGEIEDATNFLINSLPSEEVIRVDSRNKLDDV